MNDYGLRNRFAIITETPGQPTFERRIYAQYAYFIALLEYTAAHAKMQAVVKKADDDTVAAVMSGAEAGTLPNFLDGEYQSAGKIDLLAYRTNEAAYKPGTSLMSTKTGTASGPPEVVPNVDDLTKPVGTRTAKVPRYYLLPPSLSGIAAKLRAHNIRVTALDKPVQFEGEEFDQPDAFRSSSRIRHDDAGRIILVTDHQGVSGRFVPGGHGAAHGKRRVLLSRTAGARRVRRLGCDGRGPANAGRSRAAGRVSGIQGSKSNSVVRTRSYSFSVAIRSLTR